jgi:hypothetical protein
MGSNRYPKASELLITADGGGINGSRCSPWKVALQKLADRTGLSLSVSHLPPGTNKWNKIEHRIRANFSTGPVDLFVSAQVGTRFAWSISAEGRQPILKDDREVVQRLSPFRNWQRPLLGRLVNRHVHQLQR